MLLRTESPRFAEVQIGDVFSAIRILHTEDLSVAARQGIRDSCWLGAKFECRCAQDDGKWVLTLLARILTSAEAATAELSQTSKAEPALHQSSTPCSFCAFLRTRKKLIKTDVCKEIWLASLAALIASCTCTVCTCLFLCQNGKDWNSLEDPEVVSLISLSPLWNCHRCWESVGARWNAWVYTFQGDFSHFF